MLPELFRIPYIDFPIYTYGVLLATGILLGIWLAARLAAEEGLDKDTVYNFAVWVIVAALIGSKLLMVWTEWGSFSREWRRIFSLDFIRAGGVYYGGFLAGVGVATWLIWKQHLPGWKLADAFAPAIALGQSIGRLGCFSAGCCWGRPTTSWVGVRFTALAHENVGVPIGVSLHPTQLYESAATFLIFLFLLWLRRRREYPGQVMLMYVVLYAAARFVIEFYRADWRGWVGPLSTSQFIAILLGGGAGLLLITRRKRAMKVKDVKAGS